jgi:hypothetical protein
MEKKPYGYHLWFFKWSQLNYIFDSNSEHGWNNKKNQIDREDNLTNNIAKMMYYPVIFDRASNKKRIGPEYDVYTDGSGKKTREYKQN